ncbi:MAG: hypothetical protein LPH21_19605 [Shewanella sp.]|nr:hypothetical protein [Shewanella sp.]
MKYVPFVARIEAWKHSFATDKNTRHPGTKRRWLVHQKGGGQEGAVIQLVTPTQQAVERAQSEIKEMRKRGAPVEKYKTKVTKKALNQKKGGKNKMPKF